MFSSTTKASEATGIFKTNICAVLRGERQTAGGCSWERVSDEDEGYPEEMQTSFDENGEEAGAETTWSQASGEEATFSGKISGSHLRTLEEALRYCKADLSTWDVKEHQFKHWTTSMKKKILVDPKTGKEWREGVAFTGTPVTTHKTISLPNTGWTIKFVAKSDHVEKLVEAIKTHIGVLPGRKPVGKKVGSYAVEFAIFDHHLGKTGFDPETLQLNWSLDEAMNEYQKVIDFGLSKVPLDKIDHFFLPFGNDLINVDSQLGTTTSGTKISSDTLWLPLFRYAKEAIIRAVLALREYAPVHLYGVPGNHDFNGVLALSEVLQEAFKNDSDVTSHCSGLGREWHNFGRSLIGFNHGDKGDARKAHTMMIADVPHLMEKRQYRAMHVGHTHRSAKWDIASLQTRNEEFGLTYEICPSLTPTDVWHSNNLYIGNLRRSKIFGYEKDSGLEFEFIYNKL